MEILKMMMGFGSTAMAGFDPYVFNFAESATRVVGNNWVTISLFLLVLKFIAIKTPWAGDNKIHQILTGFFNMFRNGGLNQQKIEAFLEAQEAKGNAS